MSIPLAAEGSHHCDGVSVIRLPRIVSRSRTPGGCRCGDSRDQAALDGHPLGRPVAIAHEMPSDDQSRTVTPERSGPRPASRRPRNSPAGGRGQERVVVASRVRSGIVTPSTGGSGHTGPELRGQADPRLAAAVQEPEDQGGPDAGQGDAVAAHRQAGAEAVVTRGDGDRVAGGAASRAAWIAGASSPRSPGTAPKSRTEAVASRTQPLQGSDGRGEGVAGSMRHGR